MSNTIAVVIAVIGILALFAAAGALLVVLRRSGAHPVTARPEAATAEGALSPELSAEAERRIAEADLVAGQAQRQLEEAGRAAGQVRANAESDAAAIIRRAEESAEKAAHAQRAAEEQIRAGKEETAQLRTDLERREARLAE